MKFDALGLDNKDLSKEEKDAKKAEFIKNLKAAIKKQEEKDKKKKKK